MEKKKAKYHIAFHQRKQFVKSRMKSTGTESIALGKSKPTLAGAEFLSRWKEIVHEGKKYTEGISFHCREKSAKGFPRK